MKIPGLDGTHTGPLAQLSPQHGTAGALQPRGAAGREAERCLLRHGPPDTDRARPVPDPFIGRVLAERYCARRLLASSGMARVYHGHDLVAGTPCVLKFALDPQDKVACLFLRREARITAQINHDHVVRLYHYGELPFLGPYLVTEYVAGPSLATLLDRGPLPMTPAILIGAQIASALHAVHRQGFEHRDVKPTNILLDEGGALAPHARLIDFGISGSGGEGDTRSAGSRYGTPEYVAPERITGEETGALADQYSLGCVLYEILTGRTPYAGESPQSVLQQHLLGTPRPLRTFPAAQEIPLALEYVVLRAMAREPRERFESMAALRAALAACLGGAARRGHPADRR